MCNLPKSPIKSPSPKKKLSRTDLLSRPKPKRVGTPEIIDISSAKAFLKRKLLTNSIRAKFQDPRELKFVVTQGKLMGQISSLQKHGMCF
jgi:hypothetical protein